MKLLKTLERQNDVEQLEQSRFQTYQEAMIRRACTQQGIIRIQNKPMHLCSMDFGQRSCLSFFTIGSLKTTTTTKL